MALRKIIRIDQELCDGCGACITACAEGAIKLIDGKARVVSDRFCDGLGACLKECPAGALTIEEREAEEFDEQAALACLREELEAAAKKRPPPEMTGCMAAFSLRPQPRPRAPSPSREPASQLSNWPVQMRLVPPTAPYLQDARLLIAADCTAFACPTIQGDFIQGRVTLAGCPKLDETEPFLEKLTSILRSNQVKDIAVLIMEVPCCSQLVRLVETAVARSGKSIPVQSSVVSIDGLVTKG
ncbi:MAG: 4Fe-4S dicluster domain-containing protein [Methanosarcinales archaeon]|nr:4Fe-4S dicluster domain-containing protein [Methanosarcinales archaeon]